MLFTKSDKVAELTFFGADFQLLWSTLYNEDTGFSTTLLVFWYSQKTSKVVEKNPLTVRTF